MAAFVDTSLRDADASIDVNHATVWRQIYRPGLISHDTHNQI
jgi:hypothetical protein